MASTPRCAAYMTSQQGSSSSLYVVSNPSLTQRSPRSLLQLLGNHGPLDAREPGQIFEGPARLWRVPVHA